MCMYVLLCRSVVFETCSAQVVVHDVQYVYYPGKRPQTVWSVYHTQSSQKVVAGGDEAPASTK